MDGPGEREEIATVLLVKIPEVEINVHQYC